MNFVKPSRIKWFPKHEIWCRNKNNILLRFIAALKACTVACTVPGLPGPSEQKMPNHLQKMPNRFKECQTSWNRLKAVGFDITRWVIQTCGSIAIDSLMLLFTKYKCRLLGLPLSACHCLAALPAKMCTFNSLTEQNACYRNIPISWRQHSSFAWSSTYSSKLLWNVKLTNKFLKTNK